MCNPLSGYQGVFDSIITFFGGTMSVPGPSSSSQDFERQSVSQYMRRLNPEEFDRIISDVQNLPSLTPETIQTLRKGRLDEPFFLQENWIAYAFKAYFEKAIHHNRLSTLNLYDISIRESSGNVKVHHIKNCDGTLNQETFELLLSGHSHFIKGEGKIALKRNLVELKPEDLQFFSCPIDESFCYLYDKEEYSKDKCPFGITDTLPRQLITIPPLLLNVMLHSQFGEQAVELIPILGFPPLRELKNTFVRRVRVPCRYQQMQLFIDPSVKIWLNDGRGLKEAKQLEGYYFDAYYMGAVDASNPHRQLWVEIAEHFESLDLNLTSQCLFDRHLPDYLLNHNFHPTISFLLSLIHVGTNITLSNTRRSIFTKLLNGEFPPKIDQQEASQAATLLKNYLITHGQKIISQFRIDMSQIYHILQLCGEDIQYFHLAWSFCMNDPDLHDEKIETRGLSLLAEMIRFFTVQAGKGKAIGEALMQAECYVIRHEDTRMTLQALEVIIDNYHECNLETNFTLIEGYQNIWSDPRVMREIVMAMRELRAITQPHEYIFTGFSFQLTKLYGCDVTVSDIKEITIEYFKIDIKNRNKYFSIFKLFSKNIPLAKRLNTLIDEMNEQEFDRLLGIAYHHYKEDRQVTFDFIFNIWHNTIGSPIEEFAELPAVAVLFGEKMGEFPGLQNMLARSILKKCGPNRQHFLEDFQSKTVFKRLPRSQNACDPHKIIQLAERIATTLSMQTDLT